ncbi:msx2-interacting protein [Clupea harengus]|uniref:Msx2-interacting protein n=1 Tax=Clupea harengus TaxID=7950 RepID=A0A6P8FG60_CLUHA|nr:msx2-interacting protein [Clupea harengus]
MVRETRHLWVGNLPENVREEKIIEHFKRYGRVESVKVLPKRGSEGGVAAFVDFVDIKSAQKAHNSINKMGDRDLRTDYNEPGTIPSAARGLDDNLPIGSRGRDVSGFTRGAAGPVYGPPASLHSRDGRYERRLDGAAEGRERAYDHSAYGHHERGGGSGSSSSSFDRQRHYESDYYRDPRDRSLSSGGGGSTSTSGSSGGSSGPGSGGVGGVAGGSSSSSSSSGGSSTAAGAGVVGVVGAVGASVAVTPSYYGSRSRSPSRFDAAETRYEARGVREPFTLASVVHRDLYREDRGRRTDRSYHHSRSRSPHSSQSHNPSPQRLSSQASRAPRSPSGSGSRSRSSSSDSVSSTSSSSSGSESSSSSSDESPARSVQSAAVPAPSATPLPCLDKDEPRKSFGIKVQNLPVRSTDTSLKDGLFHEFKKHGKVTSVQIHGATEERYGLVFFRQQEDQEKAFSASKGKLFFGMQIEVTAWNGPETESENEFRPLDERIDEFHPKATRTLFIGNLEKTTSYHDLLNIFQRFGEIVDIDIKKVNGAPQYAFLQYCDIASVCKAIKKMDGEYLGNNRLKLGFGKSMPTTCVWLDGLASSITEQYLTRHFCRYGHVVKVVFDRLKGMALILYNNIECAQAAVKETKGWKIGGNKIKVDFANQESQMAFTHSMQASGQDIRDFYDVVPERRDERRPPYTEFSAERAYYENVRTPGTYTEDPRRKYAARGRELYAEWDPYQTDYYEPRYYEDPREYRDYRDPYDQDIRKYNYLRERERERERFETDRERDHGRRTMEHSQSPSLPRRPASPTASPSPSDRLPSDSEHPIYSRSSERSGSCSSLSPPRFEKRPDRYNKTEKADKEKPLFDTERLSVVEKEKRSVRKEKSDKDRSEKQKLRKLKLPSSSVPSSETDPDPEPDRDGSPDGGPRAKGSRFLGKEKENKGRLDLPPCVVQLTRVKEKEGKVLDSFPHAVTEKPRLKVSTDTVRSPPPPPVPAAEQRVFSTRMELQKGEILRHVKVPKEKGLASQVELVEKDGKIKAKKYLKSEPALEGTNSSVDVDRLAARKKRFEEATVKTDRLKRISEEEEEEEGRLSLKRPVDGALSKDSDGDKKLQGKDGYKREHRKTKLERLVTVCSSPTDRDESECAALGMDSGLSLDLQSRLGEPNEESMDALDVSSQKLGSFGLKCQSHPSISRPSSDDGSQDQEQFREKEHLHISNQDYPVEKSITVHDVRLSMDIDHSQSCRKQMEQNRRLQKQLQEYDKSDKSESPVGVDSEDLERRSLVHEVGKPPLDVSNVSPPSKRKKLETLDFEFNSKQERNYRSSRSASEDSDKDSTNVAPARHLTYGEEEVNADSPHMMSSKDSKDSLKAEDKASTRLDVLKYSLDSSTGKMLSAQTEHSKPRSGSQSAEEEIRWESRMKQDTLRMDMTFPSSIVKRDGIRKRPVRELEPGEVQSDSDDDSDNKHLSPKSNTSLSYLQREREDRHLDIKLSGSLEKNKFYEFALDKTITPDTKALLERAKSLSSSREDNWSFLGHETRLTTLRNSSDKERVEPTPRPIPSWYKRKFKQDSEGKLDDKKEMPKTEDHERQELFVSRFLRSSIFEQDSRRLQHLERKEQDLEYGAGRLAGQLSGTEGHIGTGVEDGTQEPIVLFHSRFLELQQQKGRDHRAHEERASVPDGDEDDKAKEGNQEQFPKVDESTQAIKPISPVSAPLLAVHAPSKETSQLDYNLQDKSDVLFSITKFAVPQIKDEDMVDAAEISPSQSKQMEKYQIPPTVSISTDDPVCKEEEAKEEPKQEPLETKVTPVSTLTVEPSTYIDVKPPTPGASLSVLEPATEAAEDTQTAKLSPKPVGIQEALKEESQPEKSLPLDSDSPKNVDAPLEMAVSISDAETEAAPPARKQPKSKKSKLTPAAPPTPPPSQPAGNEKPVTRKSERIDREKLKRASSPRGEVVKGNVDSKTRAKSPIHSTDTEQGSESDGVRGRRRRNVRSVYATLSEGEVVQQPGKDLVESPRSTRKRGADKDSVQQDSTPTTGKRGRPKTRKVGRVEDVSPVKEDQPKMSEGEGTDSKESGGSDISKVAEGWRSPRTQKTQTSPPRSTQSRKTGKVEKTPEKVDILFDKCEADEIVASESQTKSSEESQELTRKLSEDAKQQTKIQKTYKGNESTETAEKKSEEDEEDKLDVSIEKRKPVEKGCKTKPPRLTRSSKTGGEDKSLSLKNLVIHLSVDDVIGVLRSGEDEPEPFQDSVKKTKPEMPQKEDTTTPDYLKEVDDLSPDEKDEETDPETPIDPTAALLARQMELERAVENISNFTVETPLPAYKEPPAEPPALSPPVPVEEENEVEEEKPANPASETELAAAIDSITAEDISADTDAFTATSSYPLQLPTPVPVILPISSGAVEPEPPMAFSNVMNTDSESGIVTDPKASVVINTESSNQGESQLVGTQKKAGKARPKTPKKSRGRKSTACKKGEVVEEPVSEAEPTTVKLPESIPEDMKTVNPKAVTTAATVPAVVTAAAACKHDVKSTVTLDTPKEAEQPAVEQPEPQESAFHSGSSSPAHFKLQPPPPTDPIAPALTPSPTRLNVPPVRPAKMAISSPTWLNRSEGASALSTPTPQVIATPPTAPVPGIGSVSGNPPLPPDTKASDIDPNSSTLRKILMEPKYVSASNSTSVPSMVLTTTLVEPRVSENENSSDPLPVKPSISEDRPAPHTPHAMLPHPAPSKPQENQRIFSEKMVNSVISSATSVISRITPFDSDETPHISLSNRSAGMSLPKQKYRASMNENSLPRYSGLTVAEEGSSVGRPVVDNPIYNAGPNPGLRVNTSEGVVVLSYSGQKTEGPQRISAKISQIPPASAVDIEFQQSVSKSQIKQESVTPSHPSTPKGSQTPTGYGHTGMLLTGQTYNTQPVISINHGSPSSEKSESLYHSGSQGGPVKMFQQSGNNPQVLMYNQVMMQHHAKKGPGGDSMTMKGEASKLIQSSNLSPVLSSHHSSLSGNPRVSSPTTPTDRSVQHPKQEPHSPRTSGHSPSPFPKMCHPGSSLSPIGSSVVLGPNGPISQYVSNMHHQEQSVIMPTHNISQSVPMGHHSQGDVRLHTPPLSGISYGMRAESLASPRSGAQQRSTTPQPAAIRDIVLQAHAGPPGSGTGSGANEEELRHFHQGLRRPAPSHLQPDVMVVPGDYRGLHHGGLRLDQYNMASRDVRILMHHQLSEHQSVDLHKSRTPEASMTSSTHISATASKTPPGKAVPPSGKETPKGLEVKMPPSPHTESRIIGHPPVSVMMSPQGVQLVHPGGATSMPEYSAMYREMRGYHPQFPGHPSIGMNLAPRTIPPSQEVDHPHRNRISPVQASGAIAELKSESLHLRHPAMELSHVSRIRREAISPSFVPSSAAAHKSLHKGHQAVISGPPPPTASGPSQMRPDVKLEHTEHRSVDTVKLLTKYPIVWQGLIALKNDTAAVQLHFVSGNNILAQRSLPPVEGPPILRIAQRMRLEGAQLEGVARRMTVEGDYCLLLALPCGRDQEDVLAQTHALKGGFITYLQAKQAAGIINVPNPGSNQPAYVVQIFPPCEFSETHLSHLAPDLLNSVSNISPHLMIVIASV